MNKPRFVGPACLACSFSEQCGSCARRVLQADSSNDQQVRGIRFVAVDKKRPESNLHMAVKSNPIESVIGERNVPSVIDQCALPEDCVVDLDPHFSPDFVSLGYRNDGLIATTNTSIIFRASMSWFHGAVTIKVLQKNLLNSRFANKIFSQEAAMVMELTHPNIAALYDYGIDCDGAPYLVSQYVPGWSLRELISQGTVIEPVPLFSQLCEALMYAHQLNVVHGRLSANKIIASPVAPNIFLAKLIDFSVTSALRWQLPFSCDALRPSASPEERGGHDPDFRSDIFSLGCLMYEMLTGSEPSFNRAKKPIPFPRLRGVAALLEPLVVRCLADDPNDRYQSVSDLLQVLRAFDPD